MAVELPCAAYQGSDPYAFVSYAHADTDLVFEVLGRLHRAGHRFWYDEGIEPAENWPNRIATSIDECAILIAFVSPVSVARPNVVNEIRYAHGRDKPVLAIHLQPTDLPNGLELLVGSSQSVALHGNDWGELLGRVGAILESHGTWSAEIVQLRQTPPDEQVASTSGMPRRAQPRRLPTVAAAFADRVPQSEAVLASVDHQLARLRDEVVIEPDVFPNVLVFYGGGGVGKSGLSRQLQSWMSREDLGRSDWTAWPHSAAIPVRWDFHEADGNLDLVRLLVALRSALLGTRHSWLVFDLVLAAYLEAVRLGDGDGSGLGVAGPVEDALLRSLQQAAAEVSAGVPSVLTPSAVRRVVRAAVEAPLPRLARYDSVADVLVGCARISAGAQTPDVVADLLYVLTQEIYFIPPSERPALVVFADHFEKLQRHGGAQEGTIAQLVASLPYALFVITGRDRLSWTEPHRTDLPYAGEQAWPGLAATATSDPRQHLLGRLSDEDTRRLYEANRAANGWNLADPVVDELVTRSAGLPLHVEAVLQLARNLDRAEPGRALSEADLAGELPTVVHRLLQALEPDEADAFRAACVLPSFDVPLVAAVGQVSHRAAECAIRFALVETDTDGTYPHRVHDEIRRLVQADRRTAGYWADGDWRAAATRGLQHAVRRIREGHATSSDAVEAEGIVLALRIASEWDLYEPGLAELLNDGPNMAGLAPLIPAPGARPGSAADDLVGFVHALALPFPDGTAALEGIGSANPEIARYVDRWRVYRLRIVGRTAEALDLLAEMLEREPEHVSYLQHQYAVTLRMQRRFQDAVAHEAEHRPDLLVPFRRAAERMHAIYPTDYTLEMERARSQKSRRFRLELETGALLSRARSVGVERAEVDDYLRRTIDTVQRADQLRCLMVLGYDSLADGARFEKVLDRIHLLQSSAGSQAPAVPHLLALRAHFTAAPADVRRAVDAAHTLLARSGPYLGPEWITTEVWLAELGHSLPPVPTQWLVPEAQVRENWLAVAEGIIARATGV